MAALREEKGVITEIKRFATHDGPGIRTTVFLKGCPLQCAWCCNPETVSKSPEIYFISKRCKGCGACKGACPDEAIEDTKYRISRQECSLCMGCTFVCPEKALIRVGDEISVDSLINEVEKDLPFYGTDGGLTLSGGEPLYQSAFATAVLKKSQEKGINTVLDTSGYARTNVVEEMAKHVDLVLMDIKHMNSDRHEEKTGVPNDLILENARIFARKTKVRISLPLITDFNDDEDNLRQTAEFAVSIGVSNLDINPLHTLGIDKYKYLGLESPFAGFRVPSQDEILRAKDIIASYGLDVTVGRMM